jgi:hypothetical protein
MRRAPDLQWRCLVAGSHRTTCGRYSAIRVTLDDGDWWLTVYPDGSSSMPTERRPLPGGRRVIVLGFAWLIIGFFIVIAFPGRR